MKILRKNQINQISAILKEGGIVAFPTETVFGFGIIFDNEKSYKRLIDVKRRPPEKPFTMMLSNKEDIEKYAYLNKKSRLLVEKFVPGQITLLLKGKEDLPSYCLSKEGLVGIRIPDDDFVREMIKEVGKPLLVPSANKSGEAPLTNSSDVVRVFEKEIDAVIEGESVSNTPSTIVHVSNDVRIIREGIIKKEDIEKVLGESL